MNKNLYWIHQGEGNSYNKVSIVMPIHISMNSYDEQFAGFLEQEQT